MKNDIARFVHQASGYFSPAPKHSTESFLSLPGSAEQLPV
jgi:hypothetical protein